MNRKELTYRLSVLGMKKAEFAAKLDMATDTLYQWVEVPGYAVALLEEMERSQRLESALAGLKGMIARKK